MSHPSQPRAKRNRPRRLGGVLLVALALGGAFVYGYLCRSRQLFPYGWLREASVSVRRLLARQPARPGRWEKANPLPEGLDAAALERLNALGYLDGYVESSAEANVIRFDAEHAQDGFNLYVSGHAPEVRLIDMNGRLLHSWKRDFLTVWPDYRHYREDNSADNPPHYFFRAWPFGNGDVLALFEGHGLVKLDKDSNVLWAYTGSEEDRPAGCHHDLWVTEDGDVYVLTYDRDGRIPTIHPTEPIWEDHVSVLDSRGREKDRFSLIQCLRDSAYAALLEPIIGKQGHALHANSIQVLDGSLSGLTPLFRKGNLLVGFRENDTIAVVDPEKRQVLWALTGMWLRQHSARLLEDGSLLLFDNRGLEPFHEGSYFGRSRILELDPFGQEVRWSHAGTASRPFHCPKMGVVQRLSNGNTLVTDSISGRAFELTRGNEIVWEWVSPHRAGDNDELIATLTQMVRLDPDFPLDWLDQP